MSNRCVVLGLTHARSGWAAQVSRWSTGGTIAIEFIACLTADELRAAMAVRQVAAVLLDAQAPGLDRRLVSEAKRAGAGVVGVSSAGKAPGWERLGVEVELPGEPTPRQLISALALHATQRETHQELAPSPASRQPADQEAVPDELPTSVHRLLGKTALSLTGRLVGVSGIGGSGASTVAMALAQGLAFSDESIALVDAARRAGLAMYHDVGDVLPGLPELIEVTRHGTVDPEQVRALLFELPDRGYSLLLGQRHVGDWVLADATSASAAIAAVARSFELVVVDHDPDVERGSARTQLALGDRHAAALHMVAAAELMVVVADASTRGVHSTVHRIDELVEAGLPAERLLLCFNRSSRSPRSRTRLERALRSLTTGRYEHGRGPSIVILPELRQIESALVDARPMPRRLSRPIAAAVRRALAATPRRCDEELLNRTDAEPRNLTRTLAAVGGECP